MNALRSRLACFARVLILAVLPASAAYAEPVSPIPLFGGQARTEAPETLLSVDLDKGEAELYIGGSWKGEITAASGIKLTSVGASITQSDSPLLFTQAIDLTVSAKIYNRWFVEANFVDDYSLNTYRAGYVGAEGDTIRYIGIGNVGLDFPAFPYADISGGTPSSFGAYGAFGSGPLTLHALVRYDAATRQEKTYVGTNERSTSDVSPAKRLRGRGFVLPDRDLDAVPVLYLEDTDGGLSGSDGRKYRAATASEAAASATLGIVELSSTPTKRVAVAYAKGGSTSPWTSSLGAYGQNGSGSGFLGATQDAFEAGGFEKALASYPQCGGGSGAPAAITIGATNVLIVYDPGAFSPFELSNRYAPTSSASGSASAQLVYASSGTAVKTYELEESASSSFTITTNSEGETVVTTSGRFFVLTSTAAADRRAPATRFPLAALDPDIYLPNAKGRATDIVVRFTSYGSAGSYNIGTDVVAGSVIVTRGGIRDPLATYDADSGTVTLATPAGTGEIIKISYLKTSQDRRFGSLAAGLGAVYTPDSTFSARGALSFRWNVSGSAFTTADESSPGSIALSGSAAWKREDLKAEVAGALTYEAPDTTGLYRAVGMDSTEYDLSLSLDSSENAYPPLSPASPPSASADLYDSFFTYAGVPGADNDGSLVYRDYTSTDVLGNSTLKPITWTGASADSSKTGPYTVSVSELDGKTAYVAEYSLGEGKASDGGFALWAGFQMDLGDTAETLASARTIIVPFRYYDISGDDPVRAYIQIGSLADDDGEAETKELVWSQPLGSAVYDSVSETSWDTTSAAFDLSDDDRARLAGARAIRVVVRLDTPATAPSSTVAASGRLLVLPPVVQGSVFRPVLVTAGTAATAGDEATAAENVDSTLASTFSSEISRLHPDGEKQRVLVAEWSALGNDQAAGADGYPAPFPLWSYRSVTFYLRGPEAASSANAAAMKTATVRLIIAADSDALSSSGEGARFIDASIPASAFTAGTWSKVVVDYAKTDTGVSVDGKAIADATVVFRPSQVRAYRTAAAKNGDTQGPEYVAVVLEPVSGTSLYAGSFAVDEICLSDPTASFGSYASGALAWEKKGELVKLGGTALVSDLSVESRTELSAVGNPFEKASALGSETSAKGHGKIQATVLGARVSAETGLSEAYDNFTWTGAHSIDLPLGPLKLSERFADDPDSDTLTHKTALTISGPVSAEASSTLGVLPTKVTRSWKAALSAGSGGKANAAASIAASYIGAADFSLLKLPYNQAWTDSWSLMLPDDGSAQRRRDFDANAVFGLKGETIDFKTEASASSKFNESLDTRVDSASLGLKFPFRPIQGIDASFGLLRSYTLTETASDSAGGTGSAGDDAAVFARVSAAAAPLWASVPFMTLADSGIAALFQTASGGSLAAAFSDGMEASLKLPRALGWWAIVAPSSLSLTLARAFDRTYDTTVDSIKTSASVQTSAVNVLGAFGSNPLFQFYKSDEFTHALSFTAKFPKNDDVDWEVGLRQSLAFFGFADAKLTLSNIMRAGSEGWSEGTALSWTSPEEKSLMKTLYAAATGYAAGWKNGPLLAAMAETEAKAERRETVEVAVSAGDDVTWSWLLKHESIIRAGKKLTWIVFETIGASGGTSDGEVLSTTIKGSIGTSLSLKF